jgi:hypothetical protein
MWVRKTEEQLARERRRLWYSFRTPIAAFGIGSFLELAAIIRGPILRDRTRTPNSWSEAFFVSASFGVVAFIAVYVLQIVRQKKIRFFDGGKVDICDSCHELKNHDWNSMSCRCGGTFDSFDNWSWIDEDNCDEPGRTTTERSGESGLILTPGGREREGAEKFTQNVGRK